jgi:hypothetical protein
MTDQGAGVNMMPKSLFDQIGFGVIEPFNCRQHHQKSCCDIFKLIKLT